MRTQEQNTIRLSESQTEILTRAVAEAVEQGAVSQSSDTQVIRKPLVKPAAVPPATRPKPSVIV